jgi:hypothetical protein
MFCGEKVPRLPYLFYAKAEEGKMFGTVRSGRPFYLLGRRMEGEDLRIEERDADRAAA